MINIEIPPSAPVTKEEREKWLEKAEYGGKTRRLIDHIERVEAERDVLAKRISDVNECPDPSMSVNDCRKGGERCCTDCWLEWARNEAGRKGQ